MAEYGAQMLTILKPKVKVYNQKINNKGHRTVTPTEYLIPRTTHHVRH